MHKKINRIEYGEKSIYRIGLNKFLCFIAMLPLVSRIRIHLYRLAGVNIGKNCFIASYVLFDDQFPDLITIEDNVTIAYRVSMITHDDYRKIVSAITLKKKSWVGTGAIILPGVIIEENSVVGAGTIVSKDIGKNSIVVGSSNRIIRRNLI